MAAPDDGTAVPSGGGEPEEEVVARELLGPPPTSAASQGGSTTRTEEVHAGQTHCPEPSPGDCSGVFQGGTDGPTARADSSELNGGASMGAVELAMGCDADNNGVPLATPKDLCKAPNLHDDGSSSKQPAGEDTSVAELNGESASLPGAAADTPASTHSADAPKPTLLLESKLASTRTSLADLPAADSFAAAIEEHAPADRVEGENSELSVDAPLGTMDVDDPKQPAVVTPAKNGSEGSDISDSTLGSPRPSPLLKDATEQNAAANDLLPPKLVVVSGTSSSASSSASIASSASNGSPCDTSNCEGTSSAKPGAGTEDGGVATMATTSSEISSPDAIDVRVKKAAMQSMSSGQDLPGPGWKKATFCSGDRARPLWVSPDEGTQFDTKREAFQFDELCKMHSTEVAALGAFKAMKRRLGENFRIRTAAIAASIGDNALPTSEESDECYICADGGELLCCDHCDKAFHLSCHMPRLESVPQGPFMCMECLAPLLKRKYRCGECQECTREDCGKCHYCLGKKRFGGDGSYGKPCKFKRCKNLRYAAPEKMPKVDSKPGRAAKRKQKKQSMPNKKSRTDARDAAQNCTTFSRSSPVRQPPGPGWKHQKVTEGDVNVFYWISPSRKIVFQRRAQACDFEELRKQHRGDEFRAWGAYREMKRGHDTLVVNAGQYDTDVTSGVSTKRSADRTAGKNAQPASKKRKPTKRNAVITPFKPCPPPMHEDGLNCSDYKIVRLMKTAKVTFFHQRFPGRILRVKSNLSDGTPPEKSIVQRGAKYTLASAKVLNEKPGGPKVFGHAKKIELVYVQKQGLQKELAKVCAFSLMTPEKIVARLAHLQSEAQSICYVDVSKIKTIKEEGHEGCGYYPDGFFDEWADEEGCERGRRGLKSCDAIQVRVVGPQLGLAKGMLLKKRGISHIQLPKSMMKAPPSSTCTDTWAAVVIKNMFPSAENQNLGRYLDPNEVATKSWKKGDRRKPLSPMYQRMVIGYGVDVRAVKEYARQSKKVTKLRHAHLKGVIDPTGLLPENKVFVSGYINDGAGGRELFGKTHRKIFLSRSPSVAPEDAKLVSVVGCKPKDMSAEDWKQLCSYDFGTIVFPKTRRGSVPLPCIIADGDLDGDDYLALWDEKIMDGLLRSKDKLARKSKVLLHKLELPKGVTHSVNKGTTFSDESDIKWLSKSQGLMLDFPTQRAASQLVGKLYGLCKTASEQANGKFDIYNEDAVAYGRAYKDVLDVQKHGGKVFLPEHLHKTLPKSLRALLTSE